jgi:UDP-N-acetylglucosamine acyltransferase
MPNIHSTAIVQPSARLAQDVEIGAYTIIGGEVEIGAGTKVGPHVVITGLTRIGRGNRIYQFSSLGDIPQDKKYGGEPTRLEIGDGNVIREFCSFNTGTAQDAGVTRVGNDNWIMAYVHIAHDCQIGNSTVLANNAQLAGHVHLQDHAVLGGFVGIHQFVRVGAHCMIGGGSIVKQDVPPFVLVDGNPAAPRGINSEGLRRRGFSAESIGAIKEAYRVLYRSNLSLPEAREQIADQAAGVQALALLVDFLGAGTRGIIR